MSAHGNITTTSPSPQAEPLSDFCHQPVLWSALELHVNGTIVHTLGLSHNKFLLRFIHVSVVYII